MAKHTYSDKVFLTLKHKVARLDRLKTVNHLLNDADSDFTRKRKLPFNDVIMIILSMAGCPIKEELLDYFDYDINTATASAFVQARDKILPAAFEELLHLFNIAYPCTETLKGYRLIAVDGSDLNIPYDQTDLDTYKSNGPDVKGSNLFHINAAYDILSNRYVDLVIQGRAHWNEQKAMWTMAERFPEKKSIFIADRNYPTWNNMEHIIRSGKYFLIRCKDIHSASSLLRKFDLPDSEFDLDVRTTLTAKQTTEVKSHPERYRFLPSTSTFDFFDADNPFYDVLYRVVRFKLDETGEYESIITNLPREEFSPAEIKKLYHLRWSEEISFRHLKYSADLSAVHARKRSSILQEIWARAILYNFCFIIIRELANRKSNKRKRRYMYVINKTRAVHLIRDLLLKRKGGSPPPDLEALISKETLPLRPGRSDPRKVRTQSVIGFNYRFS
ncbi:MAG TPA: IS4 family transposase [Erysipelotrichaceae bacterium]|nr:IS4 family transposase [Erysipelotrichaceae bacterium]